MRWSDFCDRQPAQRCWASHLIPFSRQVSHGGLCTGVDCHSPTVIFPFSHSPLSPRRAASVMAHLPTCSNNPHPQELLVFYFIHFPRAITLTSPCLSSHLDSMPMLIPVVH
jgi:hypothetical protein